MACLAEDAYRKSFGRTYGSQAFIEGQRIEISVKNGLKPNSREYWQGDEYGS